MPSVLVDLIVIAGVGYLSFAMALAGWVAALRKGEAVTLLPERGPRAASQRQQMALVAFSLVLCAVLIYVLWVPLPIRLSPRLAGMLRYAGLALFVLGCLLVLWARRALGRMWGISTSREVRLLTDHVLVRDGPYSVIRHPMYAGWWVAVLGMILIYRTWILVLLFAFSVLTFARRARREEKVLADRFGEEWDKYERETWSLVPFVF